MTVPEPRPRPSVWGPVLIAAVLLAIIGGSAGWVIGTRGEAAEREAAREAARQSAGQSQTRSEPAVARTSADPNPTGGGGHEGGNGGQQGGGLSPNRCPDHTVRLADADGGLRRVLYIRTAQAQVWICADERDRLFYQGHVHTRGPSLVEGDNALFLTDVEAVGDAYVATNSSGRGKTVYRVTRESLVQGDGQGNDETQPVETYAD